MKTNQPLKTAIMASIITGAFLGVCSADIIYKDTFQRVGPLNGTAPEIDNSGASATWTATGGYSTDGASGIVNNSSSGDWQGGAVLPLNWSTFPDPRAEVDILVNGSWLSLTFGNGEYWGTGATALLKVYANGNVDICSGPPWVSDFVRTNFVAAANANAWNKLRIDYSNTVGTATFYLNGATLATVPVSEMSQGVGLNSDSGVNSLFTNFVVSFGTDVIISPAITQDPVGQAVFTNDAIRLSVESSGTLPLDFQWRKDGVDIPGAKGRVFSVSAANMSDSGGYSVVITNSAPANNVITSSVANVAVHLEAKTPITFINFDDVNATTWDTSFAYSSDSTLSLPNGWNNEPGAGLGGTVARKLHADGSLFAENSVTYAGFGGGIGLITRTPVPSLYFYEASANARVENLVPSATNTPGRIALRFFAPDGTIGETNDGSDLIFSVEQSCTYSSNYQAFSFVLNTANFGGSSGLAQFLQYYTNINIVQFEFTLDNFYANFVNGPNDAILVDDAKLVLRQSPPLRASWNGTQVILQWDDPNVRLEGAADVNGLYSTVSGAVSPYAVPTDSPLRYFRTGFSIIP